MAHTKSRHRLEREPREALDELERLERPRRIKSEREAKLVVATWNVRVIRHSPVWFQPLSKYPFKPLRCRLLSLGDTCVNVGCYGRKRPRGCRRQFPRPSSNSVFDSTGVRLRSIPFPRHASSGMMAKLAQPIRLVPNRGDNRWTGPRSLSMQRARHRPGRRGQRANSGLHAIFGWTEKGCEALSAAIARSSSAT